MANLVERCQAAAEITERDLSSLIAAAQKFVDTAVSYNKQSAVIRPIAEDAVVAVIEQVAVENLR